MILNSEELTLCLVPTFVLLEAGDVNDVDDLEKSTGKQSTKWKQAIPYEAHREFPHQVPL